VQSPSGASEKIFAPHFRQTLITVIIAEELLERTPVVLRKILSHVILVLSKLSGATRLRYQQVSQPCEQFPLAIRIDNAAEIGETPV
jgi:hypothetical protein